MATKIVVTVGDVALEGELLDTRCGKALSALLPLESAFSVWGDEFYFMVPLDCPLDDTATTHVSVGDIGFWPPGPALAIFFGPTPMSTGSEPVPASEVNIVGRLFGGATKLRSEKKAGLISITKA
ncbi:MAG TPA: hypothetical protein DCR97_06465 [Deltaproteobacteria bacterium]|nr:hypothetical protein [Deltaproteobacteria bacterium]